MNQPHEQSFEIVLEDEHLMVVDKAAGLVVHPAPSHREPTLAELLADRITGGDEEERAGIVHRLDRGTSGLMVVARTEAAHSALQQLIRERQVERIYIGLCQGSPRSRTGTIDAPIGRAPGARHRMAVNGAGARSAVTHFEVVEGLGPVTLLRLKLETGRTHQIRAHLKAIGNPLVGDEVYGGRMLFDLTRPFLHSTRLAFRHPVTGEDVVVESDLPQDLESALRSARAT
jgi:23S rRNA pseudouridine1911/1915/1917 synthase